MIASHNKQTHIPQARMRGRCKELSVRTSWLRFSPMPMLEEARSAGLVAAQSFAMWWRPW
jgi:hypothetical protein